MDDYYDDYGGYTKKKACFSKKTLIFSLVASILAAILGEIIYNFLIEDVNAVVFMGVYFFVFGLVLLIGLFLVGNIEQQDIGGNCLVIAVISIVCLLVFGMLFEFLYELSGEKTQKAADKYIFVIDNSGSMEQNDPNQQRAIAVSEILSNKAEDVQFAVYTFGYTIECIRAMSPIADGIGNLEIAPNGGTPIVGVLKQIREDMKDGSIPYNKHTQIILLTDGYASDNGLFGNKINSVLRFFRKNDISVSTVGLGSVDVSFLEKIAEKTGGVSVMISDVSQLTGAMESVMETKIQDRNLLSVRDNPEPIWVYVVMRILFVALLGVIFIGIKLAMVNNVESQSIIIAVSTIGSVLAAVLLELGLGLFGIPGIIMRFIVVILIGITPAYSLKSVKKNGYSNYDDYGYNDTGSGGMRAY